MVADRWCETDVESGSRSDSKDLKDLRTHQIGTQHPVSKFFCESEFEFCD
jgi:hypothetical protein